jgi:DNA-binding CsgD family transcriptional regulator
MGRLSNPAVDFVQACEHEVRDLERPRDVDAEAAWPTGPGNRQAQRRLRRSDVEQLIAAYADGNSVAQLGARFNVNRTTVLAHLQRNGGPRRQTGPKLSAEDVARAADLYRDGLSLAAIGHRLGVNASTVGKALRRADVQIRLRRGWASA